MPDNSGDKRDLFITQAARDLDWFRTFSARDLPVSARDWLEWAWLQA